MANNMEEIQTRILEDFAKSQYASGSSGWFISILRVFYKGSLILWIFLYISLVLVCPLTVDNWYDGNEDNRSTHLLILSSALPFVVLALVFANRSYLKLAWTCLVGAVLVLAVGLFFTYNVYNVSTSSPFSISLITLSAVFLVLSIFIIWDTSTLPIFGLPFRIIDIPTLFGTPPPVGSDDLKQYFLLKDQPPGLYIQELEMDGRFVNRATEISGPVHIQLLVPRVKYNEKFVPVLLLGDQHFSNAGLCAQCDVTTCLSQETGTLFSFFNEICPPDHRVDMYVEHFGGGHLPYYGLLFDNTIEKGSWCFLDRTGEYCPYNRMRWHFGDVRFGFNIKHNAITIESVLGGRVEWYRKSTNRELMPIARIILAALFPNEGSGLDLSHFARVFVDQISELPDDKSLIAKEWRRQLRPISKDELVSIFHDMMYHNLHFRRLFRDLLFADTTSTYEQYVDEYIQRSFKTQQTHQHQSKLFDTILKYVLSAVADLYTLLRMFKQVKGPHEPPCLDICAFGDAHHHNIAFILEHHFGYETIWEEDHSNDKKGNRRCLPVREAINLSAVLSYDGSHT